MAEKLTNMEQTISSLSQNKQNTIRNIQTAPTSGVSLARSRIRAVNKGSLATNQVFLRKRPAADETSTTNTFVAAQPFSDGPPVS